jgi:L-alanine-DL-glutamate epimerase-like enolase superfamily enzyme
MHVATVERFCCRLPLTERQDRILPPGSFRDIRVVHLCKVTLDDATVGWGEQTQKGATDEQVQRVIGGSPAMLMNDDSISVCLQMALWDAVSRALGVPCHALLGTKLRDATPISWWVQSASPEDWAAECADAVAAGYTTCKVKARPWWDVVEQVRAVSDAVPAGFHLDLDFNETLQNVAVATSVIRQLEPFENVAFIESPIKQADAAGNAALRCAVLRPTAGHFGTPPHATVVKDQVFDGYVIGGGKETILRQAALSADAGLPFWLQMIGAGLTTAWCAHLGAVLSHASWPTITCVNLFTTTLLTPETDICVVDGYQAVPDSPGLGVEVDEAMVRSLDGEGLFPPARVIFTAVSPSGGRIHFAQTETKTPGIAAVREPAPDLTCSVSLSRTTRLRMPHASSRPVVLTC